MKNILFLFLCAFCFYSCNNKTDNNKIIPPPIVYNFIINGNISDISSPDIFISYQKNDTLIFDTIKVNNKIFKYKNNIDYQKAFTLYFNNYTSSIVLYGNKNDSLNVSGTTKYPYLISVNGSKINDAITEFKQKNDSLIKEVVYNNKLNEENIKSIKDSISNIYKFKGISGKKLNQRLNKEIKQRDSLTNLLLNNYENFISSNKKEFSSIIAISDFYKISPFSKNLSNQINLSKEIIYKTELAGSLNSFFRENYSTPRFTIYTTKKDTITNDNSRGKYILLSFLSTTSKESRNNIQTLKKIYNSIRKDSIRFVSLYIESDTLPIFLPKKDFIPWKISIDKDSWSSNIVNDFKIKYTPCNILILPNGKIFDKNKSLTVIEKRLKEVGYKHKKQKNK